MKTIENYIDELKEKTGSDNQTAILMGVDRSVVSKIRSRGAIADDNAIKIADLLEIDREEVLIAAAIARSSGEVKKAWEKVYVRSGIAASIALATITAALLPNELSKINLEFTNNIHYANLIIVGITIALGLVLLNWSQKNGRNKETRTPIQI